MLQRQQWWGYLAGEKDINIQQNNDNGLFKINIKSKYLHHEYGLFHD